VDLRQRRGGLYAPAARSHDARRAGDHQLRSPAAPTLVQVPGGTQGGRTLFVRVALAKRNQQNNATVFYRVSPESSITIGVINQLLRVRSPAPVAAMTGTWCWWCNDNTEVVQQQLGGGAPATDDGIIAFGTDWTEPLAGAPTSSATNTPYNAVMDNGSRSAPARPAALHKLYVYFDPTLAPAARIAWRPMRPGRGPRWRTKAPRRNRTATGTSR